ncbi:50S ribosomal protein L32 ['Crotalaria aegyptiaca' phytoplasma]|uniref:Large ribosomal subunit protein bL32 n=1 Tax=Candidatus Phytoplasma crotalariae TaxID=2982627 RepID=A0ABT9D6V7_9MOLU|nr:50S ribosomal protein L32 ['Crotalaria aegyptiaca' phytoplasma]MDO8059434.1 50S ribosomal protein L32 ['Crotalaria aegyptiaca' phytoplasma]
MAVPFRRTSKTAKRKRRTHYKLKTPTLVLCGRQRGLNFVLSNQ